MNIPRSNRSQLQVKRSPECMDFSPKPIGNQASQLRRQEKWNRFVNRNGDTVERVGETVRSSLVSASIIQADTTDRDANFRFGRRLLVGTVAVASVLGSYIVMANNSEQEAVVLDPSELGHDGIVTEQDYAKIASTYADHMHTVEPTSNAYDFAYNSLVSEGQITVKSNDLAYETAKQLDQN